MKQKFLLTLLMIVCCVTTTMATSNKYAKVTVSVASGKGTVWVGDDKTATSGEGNKSSLVSQAASVSFKISAEAATGYTFSKWSDNNTTASRTVSVSASSTNESSPTEASYSATFTAKSCTVSFDQNGGEGGQTENVTATYDSPMPGISAVPTKTDYIFKGYFDSATGGKQYYTATGESANNWDKDVTESQTLYAQWADNTTLTVTFNYNDGVTESTTQDFTKDQAYGELPTPSRTGYTFDGWYDGTTKIESTTTVASAGTQTLTAKWTANTYTIAYNANGGEGTMESISCTYGQEYTLATCTFKKEECKFTGWLGSDGNTYTDGQTVENLTSENGATITLTAQWKEGVDISFAGLGTYYAGSGEEIAINNTLGVGDYTISVPEGYKIDSYKISFKNNTDYTFVIWTNYYKMTIAGTTNSNNDNTTAATATVNNVNSQKATFNVSCSDSQDAEAMITSIVVNYSKVTTFTETRSIKTGSYGTICMPCDATSEGIVLLEINGKDDDGNIQFNWVGGSEEAATNHALEAGVPYVYRAIADAQTFTTTSTKWVDATAVNGFIGTYEEKDLSQTEQAGTVDTNYFLYSIGEGADNMWHPAGQNVTLGAYKCYIPKLSDVNEAEKTAEAKAGVVFGVFGGATAVSNVDANVNANKANGKFFKNGQLVIVKNGKQYNAAGAQVK